MLSFTSLILAASVFARSLTIASEQLIPPNAWDSHMHIIDPKRFPMSPSRGYTPKAATVSDAEAFSASIDIAHFVVVLPSVYGTDNAVLLDALDKFNGTARGVCVIDPDSIDNHTLAQFHAAGVRGIRINAINARNNSSEDEIVDAVKKNAAIARQYGWALQLWIPLKTFISLHDLIPKLGVQVVADHFAHAEVGSMTNNSLDTIDPYQNAGFSEVVDLVRRKLLFVKISAPYRDSKDEPLYEDLRVVAETLILNGPDMVTYGSDWPHVGSEEQNPPGGRLEEQDFRVVDDVSIIKLTKAWAGSEAQVRRMFVDTPRRLWGWDDPSS